MAVRIGELLLKEKRITAEQLQEALNYQRQNGGKLGLNLIKLGFVKDDEVTALLSRQYGVPSIALAEFEIDPAVIKLVPGRDRTEVSDRSALARWRDADDRDDRPDQRVRHGRHQVHDGLQRRAGRGRQKPAVHEAIQKYYGRRSAPLRLAGGGSALEVASKALEEMPVLDD
jgi:type IV pilus assembly protein PilB